ncbi:MAG: DUF134 domain-containing protein [Thermodesulfobacteriota bacterium]|nr:DUF134 domain-containing protein [Thermodesulfobacteriota bacterium]
MPRPKRPRCISHRPAIHRFVPDGSPVTGEVILTFEEFEAVRLIDHEGFDQAGAAAVMKVSRQTFGRILREARYNISSALVTSKRLIVEGGCYEMRKNGRGRQRRRGRLT